MSQGTFQMQLWQRI